MALEKQQREAAAANGESTQESSSDEVSKTEVSKEEPSETNKNTRASTRANTRTRATTTRQKNSTTKQASPAMVQVVAPTAPQLEQNNDNTSCTSQTSLAVGTPCLPVAQTTHCSLRLLHPSSAGRCAFEDPRPVLPSLEHQGGSMVSPLEQPRDILPPLSSILPPNRDLFNNRNVLLSKLTARHDLEGINKLAKEIPYLPPYPKLCSLPGNPFPCAMNRIPTFRPSFLTN